MSESYNRFLTIMNLYESNKIEDIISLLFEDETKRRELIEMSRENPRSAEFLDSIIPRFTEYIGDISSEDFERLMDGGHKISVAKFWKLFSTDAQMKLFEDISRFYGNDYDDGIETQANAITEFWRSTKPLVQQVNFDYFESCFGILDDDWFQNKDLLINFWRSTNPIAKDKFLPMILDELSTPNSNLKSKESSIIDYIWGRTSPEIQEKYLFQMIDNARIGYFAKNNSGNIMPVSPKKELYNFFRASKSGVIHNNLLSIFNAIKDREFYEDFVYGVLGNVSINSNGDIIFPDERIKEVLLRKVDDDARSTMMSIGTINTNINEIKYNIALQRAINTIDEGLEFRLNMDRVLAALSTVEFQKSDSVGLRELLLLRGAEHTLLTDRKYNEGGSCIERATIIADKKNASGNTRKYPDFSFDDGEYKFHVYGPKDKAGMMLGYETNCCFRPAGNADNNTKAEGYSLYDYCNTYPYGGIMSISKNISGENVTIMGTPFLVNGNMGMFHSFETRTPSLDNKKVNDLLVEGAKNWIEKDNINVVMMTNLYGESRLNMKDKIVLPPIFRPYTDKDASLYSSMYSNIDDNRDRRHVVLAAKVDGKVLTGKELLLWYREECGSNPDVLSQKLNLHGGEIPEDYEFKEKPFRSSIIIGDNQTVSPEMEHAISLQSPMQLGYRNIIEHYYKQYSSFLEESKNEIELFKMIHVKERALQIKKLDERRIGPFDATEISNLKKDVADLIQKRTGETIPDSKVEDAVAKEEKHIYDRLQEIVSLGNPWEFADLLGVSEEVKKRIEQRVDYEMSSQNTELSGNTLTSRQKRIQSVLIGMIRKELKQNPNDSKLDTLLNQVMNGELENISASDYSSNEQLNNWIKEYSKAFTITNEDREIIQKSREESRITERARRISAYSRNNDFVETVMADVMFGNADSETTKNGERITKAKKKFNLFKFSITKGIKDREQMDGIMRSIAPGKDVPEHVDELHFGRTWFVSLNRKDHDVRIELGQNISDEEKSQAIEQMEQLLKERRSQMEQRQEEAKDRNHSVPQDNDIGE